ncbi:MAG TPA: type IV pilus secretin PilQ [Candidatus Dormibacteraeota bacterium]|nr:type IV pilus secretin PilQ [Candidatus Dormibacteraeota bacterium]
MRIMWRAWGLGALVAAGLLLSNGALRANEAPVVHVKVVTAGGATRLDAQATGAFEYSTYRPSGSLYVLELSGVSAAEAAGVRQLNSGLVKGYRILSYSTGDTPNVRLEIRLAPGASVDVQRPDARDLALVVSPAATSANLQNLLRHDQAALLPASDTSVSDSALAGVGAIRQVNLTQTDGATKVNVAASGRLAYHSMRLHNPERLVLDFDGSRLRTSTDRILSKLDPVREIRMAQFRPDVTRVVIDLRGPGVTYNVAAKGDALTVTFASNGAASDTGNSNANAGSEKLLTTKAAVQASKPAIRQQTAQERAPIPAPAEVLPVSLTQPAGAFAAPAGQPHALDIPAAPQAAPSSTGAVKYTGEPISVNLKDVDLRDFFRLIHEISGLNVVVDPNVKGSLTIVLDDVPWDQALDIVLKNNDLEKQLDGNVLRIATQATLRKEADETRDLALAQEESVPVVTTTRVLSYAKATTLAATLKKFLSPRGDIIADDRSNTLIIRDIPSTFPVIDNLIRELDRRSQQVEIEARVVEANRSFAREIGTQFGISAGTPSGNNIFSGTTETGTSPIVRNFPPLPVPPVIVGTGGTAATSGSIPLMTNLGASSPTSGIAYSFSSTNFALDMIITAAESRGVGKLLSQPKIITQNNEKATVKQGTKIPVQTIVNNTVSVQFVDAVLELDVTPQITADGTVYMDVTVENDQIDQAIPRVQGIPAIDTQSAETKVTVEDGQTVVIGGIIVTTQHTSVDQVPLVGSIPILGNLFKHTTVSSTSAELLFFLTPRILPS